MNLKRIKFFGLMICSLCKVQTVTFSKLASEFETGADSSSYLRRIQRFMAEYVLDLDIIAKFVVSLLPHKSPYTLSMDRADREFVGEDWLEYLNTMMIRYHLRIRENFHVVRHVNR
jgi:hypothetical protein